jgi:hypothetical protein
VARTDQPGSSAQQSRFAAAAAAAVGSKHGWAVSVGMMHRPIVEANGPCTSKNGMLLIWRSSIACAAALDSNDM